MSAESSRRQRRATPKSVLEFLLLTCLELHADRSRMTLDRAVSRARLKRVCPRPRITTVFHRSDWIVETNYSACSEEIT